jgi:hypothetical protein
MLRYLSAGHATAPPVEADYTSSVSEVNEEFDVDERVIPSVVLPSGSTSASLKVTLASPIRDVKTEGVDVLSGFVARKSALSTSIWLRIWASEMFSVAVRWTTWTTTGI